MLQDVTIALGDAVASFGALVIGRVIDDLIHGDVVAAVVMILVFSVILAFQFLAEATPDGFQSYGYARVVHTTERVLAKGAGKMSP
ncbi:hypothetical protein ACXM2N_06200 [Corynebacterium sp. ZY180755]